LSKNAKTSGQGCILHSGRSTEETALYVLGKTAVILRF
jgi:hypothetical protein